MAVRGNGFEEIPGDIRAASVASRGSRVLWHACDHGGLIEDHDARQRARVQDRCAQDTVTAPTSMTVAYCLKSYAATTAAVSCCVMLLW